ncbi:hypothetical protein [Nocardia lijiangensis]
MATGSAGTKPAASAPAAGGVADTSSSESTTKLLQTLVTGSANLDLTK